MNLNNRKIIYIELLLNKQKKEDKHPTVCVSALDIDNHVIETDLWWWHSKSHKMPKKMLKSCLPLRLTVYHKKFQSFADERDNNNAVWALYVRDKVTAWDAHPKGWLLKLISFTETKEQVEVILKNDDIREPFHP